MTVQYKDIIQTARVEHQKAVDAFFDSHEDEIVKLAQDCAKCLTNGGKLLFCGNGGSAADSQHIAAEFVGRFMKERQPLPALALTTDTSALTCIGNDYGYNDVFSRQVTGLGREGDVLFAISTSGNSDNIIKAVDAAKEIGVAVVNVLGKSGGSMKNNGAEYTLHVPSDITSHIQECHIMVLHILCDLIERELGF